ncbi:unnamed protein product [Bursaphelenchus xylophilus]|uniref:(pine wood nematode) hypothetical protein n=1 Tax=Bursaphelenchus xylophilus TaxID=6326 RepID=A0A1I7RUD4_BURXY|nr:unnamed protein product [Bursaphelenchus xylophilus]CAG9114046.1 unnamed protein product [Bursaphelenchus xylophilus]
MLFGRAFVLIFTFAIVQVRCDLAWSKDYPLPYRLNFTDNRRFEIGCMVVIYLRLQEGTMINLIDENGDINFHVVVHWWSIILNSRFRGAWGQQIVFCEEKVVHPDCVNHGDISEVIIERVEGGYNLITNGKQRNPTVFPQDLKRKRSLCRWRV